MARDLGGNQGVGVGNKAAQQAEQCAQQQKLPDILRHSHHHHHDGHPEGGTQQHDFSPLAISKPPPERRGDGGEKKGNTKDQPGPHVQGAMPGDAELFDVEWQKGHDQAEGGAG